jgi:hypothetical protein
MPPIDDLDTTWFDDEGELTELDESDEEDELMPTPPPPPPRAPSPVPDLISIPRSKTTRASTQKATDKSRARGGLKNAVLCLKPPRTTNYSASSLFGAISFHTSLGFTSDPHSQRLDPGWPRRTES